MVQRRSPRQGRSFDECLLRLLVVAPASGYEVVKRFDTRRASEPEVVRTAYLALHRLERRGLLTSEWRPVPGRSLEAKYYRVTGNGLRSLRRSEIDRAPILVIPPLTMLVVMAISGPGRAAGALGESPQPHLAILVDGRVPIARDELRRAGMDVTRILGAIGVKTEWVLDGASSTSSSRTIRRPMAAFVVHAVIVSRLPGPSLSDEAFLGVAPPGHHDREAEIFLFNDSIQDLARAYQKAASSVLAIVVAHEIGHVLLPPPAHSDAGIMQAPWDSYALDRAAGEGLLFTARQGALIRWRLNQCCDIVATR